MEYFIYEYSCLWNILSMNILVYNSLYLRMIWSMSFLVYELSYLWFLYLRFHYLWILYLWFLYLWFLYLWIILSMNYLVYKLSCLWFINLWNVVPVSCLIYEFVICELSYLRIVCPITQPFFHYLENGISCKWCTLWVLLWRLLYIWYLMSEFKCVDYRNQRRRLAKQLNNK